MAKKAETVEEKLRALYDLQLIDSRIDEIRNMRGELPLEVEDLKDEVAGLTTRLEKLNAEVAELDQEIASKKNDIETFKEAIKKYTTQQKDVRNNREFNALSKEIEFQDLEIQLAEKKIKEFKANIEHKKELLNQNSERLKTKQNHLQHKEAELNTILAETEKEENALAALSQEFSEIIEERLLNAYNRIRNGVKNKLAVVSIDRNASAGSFFTIPPQVQVEISARKKIMTDEHSGRILVDAALAAEEKEKIDEIIKNLK